jgi:AmiR/NasT family two-component response regulator
VTRATLDARDEADTLRSGLQSNGEIGKAVSLLMAAHRVSFQEAFDILRRTAQDLDVKLAIVADGVVQGQENQLPTPGTSLRARIPRAIETSDADPALP